MQMLAYVRLSSLDLAWDINVVEFSISVAPLSWPLFLACFAAEVVVYFTCFLQTLCNASVADAYSMPFVLNLVGRIHVSCNVTGVSLVRGDAVHYRFKVLL